MTEQTSDPKSTTQSHAAPGGDPSPSMWVGFEMWAQMAKDGVDRLQALYDELAEIEGEAYQRARGAARQIGAMMDDSARYLADLSAEWRKLTLAVARKGQQMLTWV